MVWNSFLWPRWNCIIYGGYCWCLSCLWIALQSWGSQSSLPLGCLCKPADQQLGMAKKVKWVWWARPSGQICIQSPTLLHEEPLSLIICQWPSAVPFQSWPSPQPSSCCSPCPSIPLIRTNANTDGTKNARDRCKTMWPKIHCTYTCNGKSNQQQCEWSKNLVNSFEIISDYINV